MDGPLRFARPAALLAALLAVPAAAAPTVEQALKLSPVQPGVPYDQLTAADAANCRLEPVDREGWAGWKLVTADGVPLRRFADTNGDKKLDLWCYYADGVEIYRDIDANFNGKADQYRWLGTAGTRWGLDKNEDGAIDAWRQISAEEATAEAVAAFAHGDADRFERLLLTAEEIAELGLPADRAGRLAERVERARSGFAERAEAQQVVTPQTHWTHFAAGPPGIIPADDPEAHGDVMVYENAVAMTETDGQAGQLFIGTLVAAGPAWRIIDLPRAELESEEMAADGFFFTPASSRSPANPAGGSAGGDAQELVDKLEAIDRRLAAASESEETARLNAQRADVLEDLADAAANDAERETWIRQLVDTVSVAVLGGHYPDGLQRMRGLSEKLAGNDPALAAYATFQYLNAQYGARLQADDADFAEVQEWWLTELNAFVEEYPESDETAQALLQLGFSSELEGEDEEALTWYKKAAEQFPEATAGRKAAGAARRLESVGRPLELAGETLEGRKLDLRSYRGRPVVVHYWATWCEPCKQDMKLLRKLQAQYAKQNLEIIGINVDGSAEEAQAFLKQNPLPWPHLFSPGGLDSSPLADALGVQTLPTMLLIDAAGNVARHNVHASELEDAVGEVAR